jgi:uncharacterized PurR-regulated membrane protein YhhQ (DUF165 family)
MFKISTSFLAMIAIVATSNYLVQFPINDWLTFGALTYPMSFLVTELTNRFHGPQTAKKVVYAGFIVAVFLSIWVSTPKIAFASGAAFLISQLLDISVFNRLRQGVWWYAPFFASLSASLVDNTIFWSVAFWGEDLPILTWALGDLSVKLILDLAMLTPFRLAIRRSAKARKSALLITPDPIINPLNPAQP